MSAPGKPRVRGVRMRALRKPCVRGRQIASVFCPCCARLFMDAVLDGKAVLIAVEDFPKGAPTVNDKGKRAYFGVRCARALMRQVDRNHAANLRWAA